MAETINEVTYWRKCTTCKKPIFFGKKYWICSVSTCNRARTDLVFCDLRCFDAHVPVMNHRDAGAFEKTAPFTAALPQAQSKTYQSSPNQGIEQDILVVVSKVKGYIRMKAEMNTSDSVSKVLTDHIIKLADQAIENAKLSGRQTVMDRDIR